MKLENIFDLWESDSIIDREKLDQESLNASKLHQKYHKIYTQERLILRKYETDLKQLRLVKYEFLTQGPTREQAEKGWQLPPVGRILKADANSYVDIDIEVVDLTLKIGIQHEKIELLGSIIKSIMNRGFQVKNCIDWIKFQSGA